MPGAALRLTAPAAGLVRARPPPSSSLARWDARSCRCSGRTLAESPARLLSETLPFFTAFTGTGTDSAQKDHISCVLWALCLPTSVNPGWQ